MPPSASFASSNVAEHRTLFAMHASGKVAVSAVRSPSYAVRKTGTSNPSRNASQAAISPGSARAKVSPRFFGAGSRRIWPAGVDGGLAPFPASSGDHCGQRVQDDCRMPGFLIRGAARRRRPAGGEVFARTRRDPHAALTPGRKRNLPKGMQGEAPD
jgi:hypothetical protein